MKSVCLFFVLILSVTSLCCSVTPTYRPPTTTANDVSLAPGTTAGLIEHLRSETVAIVWEEDGTVGCAGVWVGTNLILTAAHCTDPELAHAGDGVFRFATYDMVGSYGDVDAVVAESVKALVIKRDEVVDLALLEALAPMAPHPSASLSSAAIVAGMPVHVIGHTLGLAYSYSPGTVSQLRHMAIPDLAPIEGQFIQVTAWAWGGNSGGPLYDLSGNLLGLCSFRVGSKLPITFFVSRDMIVEFLSEEIAL